MCGIDGVSIDKLKLNDNVSNENGKLQTAGWMINQLTSSFNFSSHSA